VVYLEYHPSKRYWDNDYIVNDINGFPKDMSMPQSEWIQNATLGSIVVIKKGDRNA